MKKISVLLVGLGTLAMIISGCGSKGKNDFEQGQKDIRQGQFAYSEKFFKASIKKNYNVSESYKGLAVAQYQLGKYDSAKEYLDNALEYKSKNEDNTKEIYTYYILVSLKTKDYKKAEEIFKIVEEKGWLNSDFYFLKAKYYLDTNSYENAKEEFEKAFDNSPTLEMAINIYNVYLERDLEADGSEFLTRAIDVKGTDINDNYKKGIVYYYLKDYDKAILEFSKVKGDEKGKAYIYLGNIYLIKKDFEKATEEFNFAIQKGKNSSQGYNGLAKTMLEENKPKEALKYIEKGIKASNTDGMKDLYFNEVVAYEKLGDYTTALSKAKQTMDLFPNDEKVKKEYIYLQSRVDEANIK